MDGPAEVNQERASKRPYPEEERLNVSQVPEKRPSPHHSQPASHTDHQLVNAEPLGSIRQQSPHPLSLSPPPRKQQSPYMPSPVSSLPIPHLSVSPVAELPPVASMSSINSFPLPHPPGSAFSIPTVSATPLPVVNISAVSPPSSYSDSTLSYAANSGHESVSTFSGALNSLAVPVYTVSGHTHSSVSVALPSAVPSSVAAPPAISLNSSTDLPLRFTFDELNLPDLYTSFKSLAKTMRERGGSQSDAGPLAVPTNDTTPLHTPTLLPLSPHPPPPTAAHPPDTDRLPQYTVPADWFSNPDSLKESFRIASNLDWASIDLTGHPDLLESMRQAELCDWALEPALFTSLCDSLNRFFTQKGMITSGNNSPLALGVPHSLQAPPFSSNPPPTHTSLTHPLPLPYVPPANGAQLPRRALHMPGQSLQRPQMTQPANTTGK
ncbi:hypothetical protein PAMA_015269 [Pampus argenteus]